MRKIEVICLAALSTA